MQKHKDHIAVSIPTTLGREVILDLYAEAPDSLFEIDPLDAYENGEETIQLKEGCFYEYVLPQGYFLETHEVVSRSRAHKHSGRISPNIHVGSLSLAICQETGGQEIGKLKLEVQSAKASYREDYRHMLEEITEYCIDLLMQANAPVSQNFTNDFNNDARTIYQKFSFIKSIIDTTDFKDAIHKVLNSPVTSWEDTELVKDIRSVRRMGSKSIKQMVNGSNRMALPENHALHTGFSSIPSKIFIHSKKETMDTAENRFIKHALQSFMSLCMEAGAKTVGTKLNEEANRLVDQLEQILANSLFKELSSPSMIPLNSPVLQRKEGYREILRIWLMFDLAAKLAWKGGDDVYEGGKRDVAVLYEYWLFFKLLHVAKEVFGIQMPPVEDLIETTQDGLGLKLRQGRELVITGNYSLGPHKFHIQYSYNKTFAGNAQYPSGGSWTRQMRPDYTFSIWPYGISTNQAEEQELMVHIHFDAKYKADIATLLDDKDSEGLMEEKKEQRKGTYKRADLLKMHTYKDAIRRTAGAYVLYPGTEKMQKVGFHDLLPGLGAFAINPSKLNDGTYDLKNFLHAVAEHLKNKASQRERLSFKTYEIHKDNNHLEINEALPPTYNVRGALPQDTHILIGFCKNEEQYKWIMKQGLYNLRTGTVNGSIPFEAAVVSAKYLLLHSYQEAKSTHKLYKITGYGPKIYSKYDLLKRAYPSPQHELYLVFAIEPTVEQEFETMTWDITQLDHYKSRRESGKPFTATLAELMRVVVKE